MEDQESKPQKREPELPPPGFVRPLTDPEAVARWFAVNEPPAVLTEWDPFSPDFFPCHGHRSS